MADLGRVEHPLGKRRRAATEIAARDRQRVGLEGGTCRLLLGRRVRANDRGEPSSDAADVVDVSSSSAGSLDDRTHSGAAAVLVGAAREQAAACTVDVRAVATP